LNYCWKLESVHSLLVVFSLERVYDSYFGGRMIAINGLLQFLVFAAITAAAKGENNAENGEDGSRCGQENRGCRVLVGNHVDGVIICKLMDVSVVSTSSSLRVVVFSCWVFRQLEVSELINMLLFDGVNSHAHIDQVVVLAWRHCVRALVVKTVVGVKVHESVSKSKLSHSWIS
jgi:hypothetical protein